MQLNIHENAISDLKFLSEKDAEGVAYIDLVFNLISQNPSFLEHLFREQNFRDYYDPPDNILGICVKRIRSLWKRDIKVMRIRLDDESVINYRIIFCTNYEKQADGSYANREIQILAVLDKQVNKFDYEIDHTITQRIIRDYAELSSN